MYATRNEDIYKMRQDGATFEEIARKFDLTRERVRQIILRVECRHNAAAGRSEWFQKTYPQLVEANSHLDSILAQAIELERQLDSLPKSFLGAPTSYLEIGVRAANGLRNEYGAKTLADVIELTERDLLRTPNLGTKSVQEIKNALAKFGLELRK